MKRSSGILMHISSLPGKYGIGTFGMEAFAFVDFLKKSGQRYWQILPLGQTSYGDSPYQCFSAFAGNPYFIDFELLEKDSLLAKEDYSTLDYGLDENLKIDFEALLNDEGSFFWQLDKLAIEHMDKLKEGGIYIHSNAVPLGDFDPAYTPFVNKFEEMNIKFERVSCSGHAHPYDLIKIINLIKPKLLVPIHSYRPEKLYNESGDRLLPEKKQTI